MLRSSPMRVLAGHEAHVRDLTFFPDGRLLASTASLGIERRRVYFQLHTWR
jgi:hypothetical protein